MPPSDLIPEVVRGIITYMNITNAAVLYDETFSKYMVVLVSIDVWVDIKFHFWGV